MLRHDLAPEDATSDLEQLLSNELYDEYADARYSRDEEFQGTSRQVVIDGAMVAARKKRRKQIQATDVLETLLDQHDDAYPVIENGEWSDSRLQVPFYTLSHIHGSYHRSLWLPFDDIRRELELFSQSAARRIPLSQAPHRLRSAVLSLLSDHPNYLTNCFIIMPFRGTPFHNEVAAYLRKILRELGLNPLRADDKIYSDDVMANIEAYIYGCRFAVAVHDRFLSNHHNANVAMLLAQIGPLDMLLTV